MSKFCGACGTQMADDALICSNCGNQLGNIGGGFNQSAPANKGIAGITDKIDGILKSNDPKNKKIIGIAGAGVAAVIVLIIVISIIASSTGYKGTVKTFMKSVEKNDEKYISKIVSQAVLDRYDDEEDFAEDAEDTIEEIRDDFDYALDSKYRISYEILSEKDLSSNRVDEFNEAFEEDSDVEFKKVKMVKISINAKSGKQHEAIKYELYLGKEKGKSGWTLIYCEEDY